MVIFLLLLVCNINRNNVGILGVVHLEDLLLVSILGLGLVEMRLCLLALSLHLLANVVIFALRLGERGVLRIAFLLEPGGIVGVALSQFFEAATEELEGLGDLRNEVIGVFIVFAGTGLDGCKLSGPCGQRSTVVARQSIRASQAE